MNAIRLWAILLSAAMAALSLSAAAQDAVIQPKTADGVSYISGGVGHDEREALKQQAGDYNLRLAFAARSGAYLAGVKVAIRNAAGHGVFSAEADGPWMYVKLPPGSYRVSADVAGVTMNRAVKVPKKGHATVTMLWPD